MEQTPVLACEHISFCYPRQTENAIEDISFAMNDGEFVVLCGQSGCGKTTLLRHFKKNQIPFGTGSGRLYYRGMDLEQMDDRRCAAGIGYVGQNPDTQLVTDKVWHELAFGLENLGVPGQQIRRRTAEIAQYFGMEDWFHKPVAELSGGQKQILNLASVVIMQPGVLLLDEPTAQLDPIGTRRFLDTLGRLNKDMGTAVLLSEQRLEDVVPMADRILIMHQGKLIGDTLPNRCANVLADYEILHGAKLPIASAMPVAVRAWQGCHKAGEEESPVSIREGRSWLFTHVQKIGQESTDRQQAEKEQGQTVLSAEHITFAYEKGRKVLTDFSLQVPGGGLFAILGGNGSGKSTALKVMAGIYKQGRGKLRVQGKVRYLAQNPCSLFTELTVKEELLVMLLYENAAQIADTLPFLQMKEKNSKSGNIENELVEEMLNYLELAKQKDQNPMDLSGGQQQRLALGKMLLTGPDILLLDEPTKGMDGAFKEKFAGWLRDICDHGKTVILVSHDMDFCAEYADMCGLLFDGQMISRGSTKDFFQENTFYTTPASRMARGILKDCFRTEDIISALQKAGCS